MSDINDIEELTGFIFPVNLKISNQYQQKYPILMSEYKTRKYKSDSFRGGSNINLNPITCEDHYLFH